jgi:hypothetical protein
MKSSFFSKVESKMKEIFTPTKVKQVDSPCTCGFPFDGDVNHFHCERNTIDQLPEKGYVILRAFT